MLAKNQTIETTCTGLGAGFEGVCRHEGQVVFVRGALPGEDVRVKIIKAAKNYAVGRLEQLHTFSEDRVTPPCPYFPRCGGCAAQHIAYARTLFYKRQQVKDCLERIGGIQAPEVLEPLGMEDPWRYRNKGAFPVGGRASAPLIGCFAGHSHDIVDAKEGCLLQTERSDALVRQVRWWMARNRIEPYNEARHEGLIRHVMTREAKDGSAMLALVLNGKTLPKGGELVAAVRDVAPETRSIVLSENTRRTNAILGDTVRTLWGADALEDEMLGFRMRVSPRSFFQVNRKQAHALYRVTLEFCGLTGGERVWDVYCGCGSITLPLARRAARITGVEIVAEAVEDARENARRGGIGNASFLAGAAEKVLPGLCAAEGAPDVVVLDPPRKGCEPEALHAVAQAGPGRIVYVSCNPATLARDVKLLTEQGYAFVKAQPVDMFPWTAHVEAVALMSREVK